jgi:hypothetical protein
MSTNSPIKCENCPPITSELSLQVNHPSEIDGKCEELGVTAILANYFLATPVDLSYLNMNLSEGVHLPRQISTREGGRQSLYYLQVGETAMAGIITTEDSLMVRYVTRVTGTGVHAQTGDIYREQLRSRSGELIYEGEGTLHILDINKGKGKIHLEQTSTPQYSQSAETKTEVWILWSCIRVKHETSCN